MKLGFLTSCMPERNLEEITPSLIQMRETFDQITADITTGVHATPAEAIGVLNACTHDLLTQFTPAGAAIIFRATPPHPVTDK